MIKRIFFFILAVSTAIIAQAQVSITATAGTMGPTVYTNLNNAFAAINAGTHQGAITITITANTTEPSTPVALVASGSGSASYTSILVRPSEGGNWTVSSPSQTDNTAMIDLNGADNVTFNGDPTNTGTRRLTFSITPTSGIRTAVFRLSSATADNTNGAQNNTIKNCNISGSRFNVNASTLTYGIYMGGTYSAVSITNLSAYDCINNVFENNQITRCLQGIIVSGNATSTCYGLVVKNNIIGSSNADDNIGTSGISITNTSTGLGPAIVEGNDIRVGSNNRALTPYLGNVSIRGISLAQGNTGAIIRRNYVHDIINSELPTTSTGGQAFGIAITVSTNNVSLENNIIRTVVASKFTRTTNSAQGAYGIHINGATATGTKIYYNTVVLDSVALNGTATNYFSAAFNILSSATVLADVRNNIFINRMANDSAYLFQLSGANVGTATFDYNNYFVDGSATRFGLYNGTEITLANWKINPGKDVNSLNVNPAFVSATDLHIATNVASPLDGSGSPVVGVTVDFDGTTRNATMPDIGADEFTIALPVTFFSFAGKKERTANQLSWITANETNSKGFELQRSADGVHFTALAFVASKSVSGNSNSQLSYAYSDNKLILSKYYYRLKQIDLDGRSSYSNIVLLKSDASLSLVLNGVFPNPAVNYIKLDITAPANEQLNIVLADMKGCIIQQQKIGVTAGSNNVHFDVSQLSKGTYIIQVSNSKEKASAAFIKF